MFYNSNLNIFLYGPVRLIPSFCTFHSFYFNPDFQFILLKESNCPWFASIFLKNVTVFDWCLIHISSSHTTSKKYCIVLNLPTLQMQIFVLWAKHETLCLIGLITVTNVTTLLSHQTSAPTRLIVRASSNHVLLLTAATIHQSSTGAPGITLNLL